MVLKAQVWRTRVNKSAFDFRVSTAVCDAGVFRGVQRLFIIDYYTVDLRKCEKA